MRNNKLMNIAMLAATGVILAASAAHADGFFCEGQSSGLRIVVLNHNEAAAGTRTPESLTISNPNLPANQQTLVAFSDRNQTLSYQGYGSFLAKVDLRTIDPSHTDAILAGAQLKTLKAVVVDIRFSYDPATSALARVAKSIPGKVTYQSRTGDDREEKLTCKRYLKTSTTQSFDNESSNEGNKQDSDESPFPTPIRY